MKLHALKISGLQSESPEDLGVVLKEQDTSSPSCPIGMVVHCITEFEPTKAQNFIEQCLFSDHYAYGDFSARPIGINIIEELLALIEKDLGIVEASTVWLSEHGFASEAVIIEDAGSSSAGYIMVVKMGSKLLYINWYRES